VNLHIAGEQIWVLVLASPEQPAGDGQQFCDFTPAGEQTLQEEHCIEQVAVSTGAVSPEEVPA
jgi:hypothetical protein